MRSFGRTPNLMAHRPFNGLGAALYAVAGDANVQPTDIPFRRPLILDGAVFTCPTAGGIALGEDSFDKASQAIAIVKDPNTFAGLDPVALGWASQTVWLQVRTHECDVENEQLAGWRKYTFDADGNIVAEILGSARLLRSERLAAGGWRFTFLYLRSPDGLQPLEFVLRRTAGPTSPTDVVVSYSAGVQETSISVAGLTDAGSYTFKIFARNGATAKDLLTGLAITADASGPPAVTGLSIAPR